MKGKSAAYLGAAFVILLILFFITKMIDRSVERKSNMLDIDTTRVDFIHIVPPENEEVTIQLMNGEWWLTDPIDFPVEARNIHELLVKLEGMEIESIVSSRPDQQSTYEVDSSGVLVEIKSGEKLLASFIMGKVASTFRHAYFRKTDSDEILMVKGSYKYYLNRKLSDWRNKVIMEFKRESVESFKLTYPDETISVALEDTIWRADNGIDIIEASQRGVDPLLSYLGRLRAADFYDPEADATPPDFSKADCVIEVVFDGGRKHTISLLKENEEAKRYYINKDNEDIIYLVYQGTANILMKKMDDFLKKETTEPAGLVPPGGPSTKKPIMER